MCYMPHSFIISRSMEGCRDYYVAMELDKPEETEEEKIAKEYIKKQYPDGKYTFHSAKSGDIWVIHHTTKFEDLCYWIMAFILWSIGLSIFAIYVLHDKIKSNKK